MAPQITKICERLAETYPDPKIELSYKNDYTLLMAIVLSAQTTDKKVNLVTPKLFAEITTPGDTLAYGEERFEDAVKTIGLFRAKTRNIFKMAHRLIEVYGGQVPTEFEELVTLPGVGRKSANVFLNVAYGQPTIGVDTHVFRVSHRLDLAHGKTPDAVEAELMRVIPKRYLRHIGMQLVLHGRYICVARKPKCDQCPLTHMCAYFARASGYSV